MLENPLLYLLLSWNCWNAVAEIGLSGGCKRGWNRNPLELTLFGSGGPQILTIGECGRGRVELTNLLLLIRGSEIKEVVLLCPQCLGCKE